MKRIHELLSSLPNTLGKRHTLNYLGSGVSTVGCYIKIIGFWLTYFPKVYKLPGKKTNQPQRYIAKSEGRF
jgi:hypothetical protein